MQTKSDKDINKGKININKLLLFLFIGIFLISFSSAELIAKYNTNYDLHRACINNGNYCSGGTICNVTISYPNGTILASNSPMTYKTSYFNYTISNDSLNQYGTYQAIMLCQDGTLFGTDTFTFDVTGNGKTEASGGIKILFIILFMILVSLTCYLALYSIGHFLALDFDLIDLAFDWGLYFAILALYFLESFYLGDRAIEQYLDWYIAVGAILLVVIPMFAFIFSITIGSLNKRKVQSMTPPNKFTLRRTR